MGSRIEEEILRRLPVKSLLRFKCVSESWKTLISEEASQSCEESKSPKHAPRMILFTSILPLCRRGCSESCLPFKLCSGLLQDLLLL